MSGLNSHNSSNEFVVSGFFDDDVSTVRGRGFSVAVNTGVYTITLHRKYDGLISFVATVFNSSMATGEACIPLLTGHSVSDGVAGGTLTVTCSDDTGTLRVPASGIGINFIAVFEEDE